MKGITQTAQSRPSEYQGARCIKHAQCDCDCDVFA